MRKIVAFLCALLLTMGVAVGCDASLTLSLDKTSAEIEIGQTLVLVPSLSDTSKELAWTSSDEGKATVSRGKVTGVAAGKVTITASVGKVSASCEITVKPEIIIGLEPKTATMLTGEQLQLVVDIKGTDSAAVWTCSDESKATISDSGLVSAIADGAVQIMAKVGGKEATCSITIKTVTIAFAESAATTYVGKSVTLQPVIQNTAEKATFTSSATNVATVANDGAVTGVSVGETTITATVKGKSATITVSVIETSVTLDYTSLNVYMTKTAQLSATINGIDEEAQWSSSNDSVATVIGGIITPVAVGSVTITASAGGKSATCEVTVGAAKEITLSKTFLKLDVSGKAGKISENLTAIVSGEDSPVVAWSTSDANVLRVVNGELTAIGVGKAIVTANFAGFTAECEALVNDYTNYRIVRTAKEFKDAINIHGTDFALANDIDLGGEHFAPADKGVTYVLDGNGYTLSNFTVGNDFENFYNGSKPDGEYYAKGMFGFIAPTGVVKNINITGAVGWFKGGGSVLGIRNQGLIENVYLRADIYRRCVNAGRMSALVSENDASGIIRNVIVEAHSFTDEEYKNYLKEHGVDDYGNVFGAGTDEIGTGAYMQGLITGINNGAIENCYASSVENNVSADIFGGNLIGKLAPLNDKGELQGSTKDLGAGCGLKTLDELKATALFGDSWNKAVWNITEGNIPTLRNSGATAPEIVEIYSTDGAFIDNKLQLQGVINTSNTISWATNDETIATVDSNGMVTAHGVGEVTITATATNGDATSSVKLTIELIYTDNIKSIIDNKNYNLTFIKLIDEAAVVWSSSETSVVAVQGGTIKGLKAGSANIIAIVNGKKYAHSVIVKVAEITLGNTSFIGYVDDKFNLNVTLLNIDGFAEYTTNIADIVTVSAQGEVTLLAKGEVIITVTVVDSALGITRTATCAVEAKAKPNFSLTHESVTLDVANIGSANTFTLGIESVDALESKFTSGDNAIVTVSAAGVVTAVSVGTTTVKVVAGNAERICTITVKDFTGYNKVSSTTEFLAISNTNYDVEKNYVLTNDIDFKGALVGNLGLCVGTVDGNGHTVKNFCFGYASLDEFLGSKNKITKGLFEASWNEAQTNVVNINFTGIKAYLGHKTGILASFNYGTLKNIYMEAEVYVRDAWNPTTGILVGENCVNGPKVGKIQNCIVIASSPMTEEEIVAYAKSKGIQNPDTQDGVPVDYTKWYFCSGQDKSQGILAGTNKGAISDCYAVSLDPYNGADRNEKIMGRLTSNNAIGGNSDYFDTVAQLKAVTFNNTWDTNIWDFSAEKIGVKTSVIAPIAR